MQFFCLTYTHTHSYDKIEKGSLLNEFSYFGLNGALFRNIYMHSTHVQHTKSLPFIIMWGGSTRTAWESTTHTTFYTQNCFDCIYIIEHAALRSYRGSLNSGIAVTASMEGRFTVKRYDFPYNFTVACTAQLCTNHFSQWNFYEGYTMLLLLMLLLLFLLFFLYYIIYIAIYTRSHIYCTTMYTHGFVSCDAVFVIPNNIVYLYFRQNGHNFLQLELIIIFQW